MTDLTHNLNTFKEVIQIRQLIARIYWSIKKDSTNLRLGFPARKMDTLIYYEIGKLVAYTKSINKDNLAEKFICELTEEGYLSDFS